MADKHDLGVAPTLDALSTREDVGETQVAALIANRYAILGLLGAGGMGRVYRAHDRTLDEIVALKILSRSSSIDRFRAEVKLARRVTSPHVVRTFEAGEHGRDQFLTMEFVEGQSLSQLLDDGPPPLDETLRIARAMGAGIAAAHAAGVLHRDLKPDNVLIGKDGRVAITDFGIAATADGKTADFAGTPAYAAPEQMFGEASGAPVDVYAFGAILFEMLAGRSAFVGGDLGTLIAARRAPPPDPRSIRKVPDALALFTMRCMAQKPVDRFADGAALARALAALDVERVQVAPELRPAVPGRSSRAIAVLPLRAAKGLEEIASGLGEEIVDAFAMTRALRVRPMPSVRRVHAEGADPVDSGRALGVDVVIDGSLRPNGSLLRLTARAIGVADGFVLSSTRFDARPDALLSVADELAQTVATALAVNLPLPARAEMGAEATALFLEAKAKLRVGWLNEAPDAEVALLERAATLAPDAVGVMAMLSMGLARQGMLRGGAELARRARELAENAVTRAPDDGETYCALGIASLYEGRLATAAGAFVRAVRRAPGNALAQAYLGSILLDAGMIDEAVAHLEGALALDPANPPLGITDLARAYMYLGRFEEADALLAPHLAHSALAVTMRGRFALWRGERAAEMPVDLTIVPSAYRAALETQHRYYRTHAITAAEIDSLRAAIDATTPRFRAANAQFVAEILAHAGERDRALDFIEVSASAGLQDRQWVRHCPLLAPLRELSRFRALASIVESRAQQALAAVHQAQIEP